MKHDWFAFFLVLVMVGCASEPEPTPGPPNILLIFTDDQGYADLGSYGGTHVRTPALDELAAEGVRFTRFRVAQAVCSASRAALLTGNYPNRLGIRGALGPGAEHGLPREAATVAELLSAAGYQSHMIGKWHLGSRPGFLPTDRGFSSYYGIPYSHDMWKGHPEAHMRRYFPQRVPLLRDSMVADSLSDFTTLTGDYNREALRLLNDHDPTAGPLFLYLAHSLPHVPLYEDSTYGPTTGLGLYADVIAEIDRGVADLRALLEKKGMAGNTLIVYTSDNGPWLSYGDHAGQTGGLREGKGTSFEGGVRVPLITYLPGRTKAGTVSDAPLMSIDLLPSLVTLTGATPPDGSVDGYDRLDDFLGQTAGPSPAPYAVYWLDGLDAVVSPSGRWKLHLPHRFRSLDPAAEPAHDGYPTRYFQDSIGLSLFDLNADPGETTDVSAAHPDTLRLLLSAAEDFRQQLGDSHTAQ